MFDGTATPPMVDPVAGGRSLPVRARVLVIKPWELKLIPEVVPAAMFVPMLKAPLMVTVSPPLAGTETPPILAAVAMGISLLGISVVPVINPCSLNIIPL